MLPFLHVIILHIVNTTTTNQSLISLNKWFHKLLSSYSLHRVITAHIILWLQVHIVLAYCRRRHIIGHLSVIGKVVTLTESYKNIKNSL